MSNDLGLDRSGNGNYWTVNNLATSDQMLDSPTNNFPTWNPLAWRLGQNPTTLSEGNLSSTGISTYALGTLDTGNSGKWYWEVLISSYDNTVSVGLVLIQDAQQSTPNNSRVSYDYNGNKHISGTTSAYGAAYAPGDIIGMGVDVDNGTITFYKNGVSQGVISADVAGKTIIGIYGSGTVVVANFGQDSSFAGNKTAQGNQDSNDIGDFYYTPPTDFLALCSANLPDPTVKPSEHFNTVLYTGTGSSVAVTGVGFQPDLVWGKKRSAPGQNNWLIDSVRGAGVWLTSDGAGTEGTEPAGSSFTSDGFTTNNNSLFTYTSGSYVLWNWKAGGAAVSNTSGSITSSVSANVDAGFSIMTYTGTGSNATIGHGLSKAPDMWVVKPRTDVNDNQWFVCHTGLDPTNPATKFIHFDTNGGKQDNNLMWNDTLPTATTIALGSKPGTNNSGGSFVAYAFHSVDGYSKFGSYTGNGSADGTFVHLGFRPAYVMVKSTGVEQWIIHDNKRDTYNPNDAVLYADASTAEDTNTTYRNIDILSNGFKQRSSQGQENGNGLSYIYLAFAEMPFKWTNAR